jgi:hypothetical protein
MYSVRAEYMNSYKRTLEGWKMLTLATVAEIAALILLRSWGFSLLDIFWYCIPQAWGASHPGRDQGDLFLRQT